MGQRKGYKQTQEHKEKLSYARKKFLRDNPSAGFQKNNDFCKNFTGKKHSKETKEKISKHKKINNPMFNLATRQKVSQTRKEKGVAKGENNPNWKGGITSETQKIRHSEEYNLWRKSVFERDGYTCQECGAKSCKGTTVYLQAHHIKPFAIFIELRFDVDNGTTLCRKCHAKKPKGHEIHKMKNE